jgi:hypothetical protein
MPARGHKWLPYLPWNNRQRRKKGAAVRAPQKLIVISAWMTWQVLEE